MRSNTSRRSDRTRCGSGPSSRLRSSWPYLSQPFITEVSRPFGPRVFHVGRCLRYEPSDVVEWARSQVADMGNVQKRGNGRWRARYRYPFGKDMPAISAGASTLSDGSQLSRMPSIVASGLIRPCLGSRSGNGPSGGWLPRST